MRALILLLFLVLLPLSARAVPTIGCHCFQDRTYDPQRPTAADDYFLATAQNTLFAALVRIDKQEVVRAKMAGADGAELWVSWALAEAAGVDRERVATLREEGRSWRQVQEELRLPPEALPPVLQAVLLRNESTATLATQVVDTLLLTRCQVTSAALRELRSAGADDQQTILALVLARKSGRPARAILADAATGRKSWSAQLSAAGIAAGTIGAEVAALLR